MKKFEDASCKLRISAAVAAIAVAASATLHAATNDFYVGASYTVDATHFNTVQAAFDAVVEQSEDTTVIHLDAGTYAESVMVTNKLDNILLLGDEKRGIAIPPKGAFSELFAAAFEAKDGGEQP